MKSHYLFPGQFFVSREPCLVTTILGSCVAVALFDPSRRIAALNHYLLPRPSGMAQEGSLRYGSVSLPLMIEEMLALGARSESIQAKVYGGARVLDNVGLGESIGKHNIDFALDYLKAQKIPVLANELAGHLGRKIVLNTSDFSIKHELMSQNNRVDTSGGRCSLVTHSVRVVLVDDSAAVRSIFSNVLGKSGRVEVVGVARDAFEAREVIVEKNPDVVLLDIEMPGMSGVKFLEKLMQHFPIPTIMVSSLNPEDDAAVRALELGALEFAQKPDQFDPNTLRFFAESLVQKVVAAASAANRIKTRAKQNRIVPPTAANYSQQINESIHLVMVGGNGGAYQDLEVFVQTLPSDTPPVLVSISSVSGLLPVFLEKWKNKCRVQLKVAVDGLVPLPGTVYFAPPQKHLSLELVAGQTVMRTRSGVPVCLQIPSCDVLFQSAVNVLSAEQLKGVVSLLMSGIGSDGVQGLLQLREKGARTIVAHPESSLFAFAPQAAISAGAADDVLSPEEMSSVLMRLRSKAVI
ncbi:response regulator [bacterium]|nr:response regulator [bacterium]